MADVPTFDDPDEFDSTREGAPKHIEVRFSGMFIDRIDKLASTLRSTVAVTRQDEARQLAVATAVATLSKYAGQQLYVERHGRQVPIEDLWR